ncbi:MAG TPA: class I SAM-dependent methyltransferase [Hydrogenophaga sp.]|jgi:SAM-dependent methyltransferase|uniref:class I SAM-dependent methyltransferase n=1 Tax=Hydrogenophaga sp. TaxID=1904254 RepID=UPI002C9AD57A|nr:class I SAM-dependent methyltransferase [Hydrogenophaga sp.]HSX91749.1 class I SAM-dependent methyltransferase [Hydrogenophaga sp.]
MTSPTSHDAQRVSREAEIYDNDELERDRLEAVMAYTQMGPARRRRDELIRAVHTRHTDTRVLEVGSQAWEAHYLKWNLKPTQLTCINISDRELDKGRQVAQAKGLPVEFKLMDAHELQFPDATFDLVFGTAILHHLEFERAVKEIARVTKPGGEILFVEPLLLNPVARLVRALTPKARTPDEKPLAREELDILDRYFAPKHLYTDLFAFPAAVVSKAVRAKPSNWMVNAADRFDAAIASSMPSLGAYYRTVTVHGTRRV